jgi:hypothetical protein
MSCWCHLGRLRRTPRVDAGRSFGSSSKRRARHDRGSQLRGIAKLFAVMGPHGTRQGARPVVLFMDCQGWNVFRQLAAAVRRAGGKPVLVLVGGGLRRRAVGRIAYGTVLRAERHGDMERLASMVHRGRVVDMHLGEPAAEVLGPGSTVENLLRGPMLPRGDERWRLMDKAEVASRLKNSSLQVPEFRAVDPGATVQQLQRLADELGFPVVLKRRVEAGGEGVVVAHDRREIVVAGELLCIEKSGVLLEAFVRGEVVHYAALCDRGEILCQASLGVEKANSDPLGASARVWLLHDSEIEAAGPQIVRALGCEGLVNLEFIRDPRGSLYHIDCSTRAFGNMACLSLAGVDLLGAYLRWLGLPKASSIPTVVADHRRTELLAVFPVTYRRRELDSHLLAIGRDFILSARPYWRLFGMRYVLVAALEVATSIFKRRFSRQGVRERRHREIPTSFREGSLLGRGSTANRS